MSSPFPQFPGRPVPPVTPDTEGWWDHTREGQLTVQTCAACGASHFYPRWLCVICGSADVALVPVAGTATVYSSTVVNKSPNPELFVAPYVVALVRLDEGPTLLTNIVGQGALDVSCDDRVTLTWDPLPDGRQLPLFTPGSPDPPQIKGIRWTSP